MRLLTTILASSLLTALIGPGAHAQSATALRLIDVAVDKPVVTLAIRTVPGATALALVQGGRELQRYAPPANNPEGQVPISLTPGSGAVTLTARAYGAGGQVLSESAPLTLDPQAFAPEPLAIAAESHKVTDTLAPFTISSLTPKITGDGLPGANVSILLNGRPIQGGFLNRHGHLTLGGQPLPLGRSELTVELSNAWGKLEAARFKAYNLGERISASTYALVDRDNYSLYWVQQGILRAIYPIATGRPRTPTPIGTFVMGKKEVMPPNTGWGVLRMLIYSVDPYGRRHWGGYAIHGTDQPTSIGKEASHGCVRMFNDDVVKLSQQMPLETTVVIKPKLAVVVEDL